jgi:hypothetical protein
MRWPLTLAALAESGTGIALLIVPSLVGRLLLGVDLSGTAELLARFLGIALIGLGVACWPGPARRGMLVYGGAAAAYLAYVGLAERMVGILLWPAVALHLILAASLVWASKR